MGQNQLLMIVLSVIVVGVSVAVGIDQFGENAMSANRDAVAADSQRIVSTAQQWFRKPISLGGGGGSFTNMTLADLGIGGSNHNGSYALTVDSGTQLTIVATGTEKTASGSAVEVTLEYFASNDSTAYDDNL
jgi:hypothetical protein